MNKVSCCMTRAVRVISPEMTVRDAAQLMEDCDIGALPVGKNGRLLGMLTDRDIALRGLREGKSPETPVREIMTKGLKFCFEDQEVAEVAQYMSDMQIRRLPVMSRANRLVGIVALGDLAADIDAKVVGFTLAAITQPNGHGSHMFLG